MKRINIFISSPGDVQQERLIAKRVINKLSKEFDAVAEIRSLLWEDMPLPPTMGFQEGIDTIINSVQVDIAVFIIWSRLGTPLNKAFTRKDGTPYSSGTEYEYDLMVAANEQTGSPDILAYVKTAPTQNLIKSIAENELEEFLIQRKAAEQFLKQRFYDKETNTVYGAYFKFEKPTSFENQLTTHLRNLILKKVGADAQRIAWEGNPYVGLRSFEYSESEIFYGRNRVVNNIMDRLIQALPKGAPTLFILGKSGCGKSSLVRAGLFPDICDYGLIPDCTWKRFDIHPGEYNESFYKGLCDIVFELFPDLRQDPCGEDLENGIPDNYDSRHLISRIKQLPILSDDGENVVPLIYVDQFEELFTHPQFSEEDKKTAIHLLRILSESGRIWLLLSMRNDFYYEFAAYPDLSAIKDSAISYDIPSFFSSEYQEIVEEPAKKAGVSWDVNERGESLSRFIANEISSRYSDLPLIEFALSRLYEKKDSHNKITFEAYREIGHLRGAIVKYADDFYASLTPQEKEFFSQILSRVITGTGQSKMLFTRKAVALDELPTAELRAFAQKLIKSHLFTADKDSENHPTITLAHEILIKHWAVIRDWINLEKDFINQNDYFENAARHWHENKGSDKYLILEKESLPELEYFLTCWGDKASSITKQYLKESIKKIRRRGVIWAYLLIPLTLFFALGALLLLLMPEFVQSAFEQTGISLTRQDTVPVVWFLLYLIALHIFWIVTTTKTGDAKTETKKRLAFWTILLPFSFGPVILSIRDAGLNVSDSLIYSVLPILNIIMLIKEILRKKEIKNWEQRIYKDSIRINTVIRYIISGLVYILAVAVALSVLAYYSSTLQEQAEKLKGLEESINESYDYLDALEGNMSPSDFIFINTQRLKSYSSLFQDELFASTEFSSYDWQYAKAQFNLRHPEKAYNHINIDHIHDENSFVLFCRICYESGHTDLAASIMEAFFETIFRNPDGSLTYSSFSNLTWTAEIVGRSDLALEAFESGGIDFSQDPITHYINYGHACLLSGDIDKAIEMYDRARNTPIEGMTQMEIKKTVNKEIGNDYAVLRWHGIDCPHFPTIAQRYGFTIRDVYTSPSDTTMSISPYTGDWVWHMDDQKASVRWSLLKDNQIAHYDVFDDDGEIPDLTMTTRYRFREFNNQVVYEEYNYRTNQLATGTVEYVSSNELIARVIDNGDPNQVKEVRHYIKE